MTREEMINDIIDSLVELGYIVFTDEEDNPSQPSE